VMVVVGLGAASFNEWVTSGCDRGIVDLNQPHRLKQLRTGSKASAISQESCV